MTTNNIKWRSVAINPNEPFFTQHEYKLYGSPLSLVQLWQGKTAEPHKDESADESENPHQESIKLDTSAEQTSASTSHTFQEQRRSWTPRQQKDGQSVLQKDGTLHHERLQVHPVSSKPIPTVTSDSHTGPNPGNDGDAGFKPLERKPQQRPPTAGFQNKPKEPLPNIAQSQPPSIQQHLPHGTTKGQLWQEQLFADSCEPVETVKKVVQSQKHCQQTDRVGQIARLPFPRRSRLTKEEQKKYLDLCAKYKDGIGHVADRQVPVESTKEVALLKELHVKVAAEQEEFLVFLEQAASMSVGDYRYIHPTARRYAEEYLEHQRKRVCLYPQYYAQRDSVPLLGPKHGPWKELKFDKILLQMGRIPRVIIHTIGLANRLKVSLDYDRINNRFPVNQPKPDDPQVWHKSPCSTDKNAEMLATKYEVDVVMSSTGLKCILDNHAPNFEVQWEIPVVIREYPVSENGTTRKIKVVYIDKPLPPKSITTREKSLYYHKFALRTLMQHPSHKNTIRFGIKAERKDEESFSKTCKDKPSEEADLFESSSTDLADLETFGTNFSGQRSAFKKWTPVKKTVSDDIDASESVDQATSLLKVLSGFDECDENVLKIETSHSTKDVSKAGTNRNIVEKDKMSYETQPLTVLGSENDPTISLETNDADRLNLKGIDLNEKTKTGRMQKLENKFMTPGYDQSSETNRKQICSVTEDSEDEEKLIIDVPSDCHDINVQQTINFHKHSNEVACGTIDLQKTEGKTSQSEKSELPPKRSEENTNIVCDYGEDKQESDIKSDQDPNVSGVTDKSPLQENIKTAIQVFESSTEDSEKETKLVIDCGEVAEQDSTQPRRSARTKTTPVRRHSTRSSQEFVKDEKEKPDRANSITRAKDVGSSPLRLRTRSQTGNVFQPSATSASPLRELARDSDDSPVVRQTRSKKRLVEKKDDVVVTDDEPVPKRKSIEVPKPAGPPPPRKRGRPRKCPLPNDSSQDEVELPTVKPDIPMPRKRGRPRKDVSKDVKIAVEAGDAPQTVDRLASLDSTLQAEDGTDRNETINKLSGFGAVIKPEIELERVETNVDPASLKSMAGSHTLEDTPMSPTGEGHAILSDTESSVKIIPSERLHQDANLPSDGTQSEDILMKDLQNGQKEKSKVKPDIPMPRKRGRPRKDVSKDVKIAVEAGDAPQTVDRLASLDSTLQAEDGTDRNETINKLSGFGAVIKPEIELERVETNVDPASLKSMAGCHTLEDTPMSPTGEGHAILSDTESSVKIIPSERLHQDANLPSDGTQSEDILMKDLQNGQKEKSKAKSAIKMSYLEVLMQDQHKMLASSKQGLEQSDELSSLSALPGQSQAEQEEAVEDARNYSQPDEHNITYNLWRLGELKLLIRNSIHGNIKLKNKTHFVSLMPKLEYQPRYGVEQTTHSETCRGWASLLIRKKCKLLQARVNAFTSEVMMLDELTMGQVLHPKCKINPQSSLTMLAGVLTKLTSLPVGCYLLSHVPGNAHAHIKKSVETKIGVYDFHLAHLNIDAADDSRFHWVPIDPSIQLPLHKKWNRIPATFDPRDPNVSRKGLQKKKKQRRKFAK